MVGIDPGQSGGIVKLDNATGDVIFAEKLEGKTETDIADLIREFAGVGSDMDMACIEKVGPSRGRDRRKQGVASTGKFMQGYGFLRGCLIMAKIRFEQVPAQRWQKAMNCLTHGDKNVSKAAAQRRWPNRTWTHAIADAALIAEYARTITHCT